MNIILRLGILFCFIITSYGNSYAQIKDYAILDTIDLRPDSATSVEISPDGNKVYFLTDESLVVVSTGNNEKITKIPIKEEVGGSKFSPIDIAISIDGTKLFITEFFNGDVIIVDTRDKSIKKVIRNIPFQQIADLDISNDGTRLYLISAFPGEFIVYDLIKGEVVKSKLLGQRLYKIKKSPNQEIIYVVSHEGYVYAIDLRPFVKENADLIVKATKIGDQLWGIAFTPDGKQVLITIANPPSIAVINVVNNKISRQSPPLMVSEFKEFEMPIAIEFEPNGEFALVTSGRAGRLLFIHPITLEIIQNLNIKENARDIAFTPDGKRAFIATGNFATVIGIPISLNDHLDRWANNSWLIVGASIAGIISLFATMGYTLYKFKKNR